MNGNSTTPAPNIAEWRADIPDSPRINQLQHRLAKSHMPTGLRYFFSRTLSAATKLETSFDASLSLQRLRSYQWSMGEKIKYAIMIGVALFSLFIMQVPGFPLKLGIPAIYAVAILLPVTSQFFLPAAPIFTWLIFFYSSKFIPAEARPHIWVSLLPTLERIWYGASISDILTRFGHPLLDVLAWIPYGVVHFTAPFVVAACLFIFGPRGSIKFFGTAFGFMNLIGVLVQILFPCAPPWYELREGLTPANYSMKGSPAGLARIDQLFGGHGYTLTFSNAPVPFGAFPSLHAGSATMEALFCSYFFPVFINLVKGRRSGASSKGRMFKNGIRLDMRVVYWIYAGWLYWCTMYLMHHYLIDLVAGGCLATVCFFYEIRDAMELQYPYRSSSPAPVTAGPSPLRPNSAFGVRRSANGRMAPGQLEQEQFAVGGAGDESDEDEDDDDDAATIRGVPHGSSGGGDPSSSMQMEPLLRGTSSRRREPSSSSTRVSSGLRDVLFSAEGDDVSSSADDVSGDDEQQPAKMPPLLRMTSASQAA